MNVRDLVLKWTPAQARLLLPISMNVGCGPFVVVLMTAALLLMLSLNRLACMTPLAVVLLPQKLMVR